MYTINKIILILPTVLKFYWELSPNIAHGKRFKLIKHELLTPSPCCWVILNCFKPEKNWIIISTRLVGLQFTVPFRIIRIFQYNVKMEISAKLKARHVQIHIFHTKQNGIPWCHEYWKWSSQIQSDRLLSPPVFLYWPFQGGTSVVVPYCSCCLCLYFGSSIMLVTYFVNFR